MRRWWQQSLAGRFVALILLALLVGQSIAFLISSMQREAAIRQTVQADFINRSTALSKVLGTVPTEVRQTVLIASSTGYARFWLSDEASTRDPQVWFGMARFYLDQSVQALIRTQTPGAPTINLAPKTAKPKDSAHNADVTAWQAFTADSGLAHARFVYFSGHEGMGIVGQLDDGSWLNAAYHKPNPVSLWSSQSLLSVGITATVLCLIGVLVARQIARPLQQLTASAEALGRGESIQLQPPSGPDDVRQLYESFNRMQLRLHRFIVDRTHMLAAIGHDLRTPLTTLRLRAEFIPDAELQGRILDTVAEMQAITEATLSFAKHEGAEEETRVVDITALLGSLCDDLAELGLPVEFLEGERLDYRCRPNSLRRAIRNLIENAVRYGGSATVRLQELPGSLEIWVQDAGPGIPPEEMERVFEPFYRLEHSRNRNTGGVGLGLSIARAVARQHGGDLHLHPLQPGLQAVVSLPHGNG